MKRTFLTAPYHITAMLQRTLLTTTHSSPAAMFDHDPLHITAMLKLMCLTTAHYSHAETDSVDGHIPVMPNLTCVTVTHYSHAETVMFDHARTARAEKD